MVNGLMVRHVITPLVAWHLIVRRYLPCNELATIVDTRLSEKFGFSFEFNQGGAGRCVRAL